MRDWDGKRYWLVGASEGLGREVALKLSRMGVEVIVSARSEERLQDLVAELPGRASYVPVDVSDPASVATAFAEVGEIDGFLYLAGAYWPMKTTEWDGEKAEAMVQVNLLGAMRCLAHVVPAFVERDRGHIVLTGSLSAFRGLPGAIGYGASKAGIASLAETMQGDLRGTGVEVQVVHPGFIKTRLTEKNDFTMPMIMEPDAAAAEFVDHMATDHFQKSYPVPFSWLFRLTNLMPLWLFNRIFS
ncbi:SDR family NAD(P)-dependent oxidoreductase [Rhodobacterales bacterium HKCCE3408]|nr:SDR family NAD(P)-dependent oxidoreductase [Rhodobacterales bacterium HKCCE3408]